MGDAEAAEEQYTAATTCRPTVNQQLNWEVGKPVSTSGAREPVRVVHGGAVERGSSIQWFGKDEGVAGMLEEEGIGGGLTRVESVTAATIFDKRRRR